MKTNVVSTETPILNPQILASPAHGKKETQVSSSVKKAAPKIKRRLYIL